MRRATILVVAGVLFGSVMAALPGTASAASTYCSASGDVCYGVVGSSPPVRLGITLAARYFTRFQLCVTGPDGHRDCRTFRVRPGAGGTFVKVVRWSSHFPNRGHGTYRARWRNAGKALGPAITFRRSGGPSILTAPSSVRAGAVVRVFGSSGGCGTGSSVTLISKAFPHTHDFAGLPAVFAKVKPNDRYSVKVRIPRAKRGKFAITARCGGGSFGISRQLTVLPPA